MIKRDTSRITLVEEIEEVAVLIITQEQGNKVLHIKLKKDQGP